MRFWFLLLGGSALAYAACSLGLDPTKIDATDAGGTDGTVNPEGNVDLPDGTVPTAGECTKDEDCTATACGAKGRCDTTYRVCMFTVCDVGACKAASCDPKANACSVPTNYGFRATSFRVTLGGVNCGNPPTRCIAAVHPFLFVATNNGLATYLVADPSNQSPPTVSVTGVPFIPSGVFAVERRVYILGGLQGAGPSFRLPVAWIDVPGNPFAAGLAARSALVSLPAHNFGSVLPNDKGGLFLVHHDGQRVYPTALLNAPVADTTTLQLFPLSGMPGGSTTVASSGSRLVTYRYPGNDNGYLGVFSIESNAGTGNAQNGGELTANAMGQVPNQAFFTQGPDGSVLWSTSVGNVPTDGGPATVNAARLGWLIADAKATALDLSARIDLEVYSPPIGFGSAVAGPVAWLDAQSALGLAASKDDRAQTSVQVATKTGLIANRRFVLPVDVNRAAAVASGGFGYVLIRDDPDNKSAGVHVFAPGCP
jgi:hypothetical protein